MALDVAGQADWGGGIYRGRKAPENSVYDAENALVDDEADLFGRGGSAFRSTSNAGAALLGLLAASTAGGVREIAWGAGTALYVLDDAQGPVTVAASSPHDDGQNVRPFARGAQVGPFLLIPKVAGSDQVHVYAGSRKPAYAAGTVSVENGSRIVDATGTLAAFIANVDAGMMLWTDGPSGSALGGIAGFAAPVVQSVESDSLLTLRDPYPGPTEAGKTYALRPRFPLMDGLADALPLLSTTAERFVTSAGQRALVAAGNRVLFNEDFPAIYQVGLGGLRLSNPTYHELPQDAVVTGADSIEDTAIIFTNTGVWTIANLAFDAVDDSGNVQHIIQQISKDLILWGDPGITAFGGQLVVPTLEDVYVMGVDGPQSRVSDSVRPMYRSYVAAGYQLGTAAVYAGHYFLPVVDGTTLVDVIVCRLDREAPAWTRWSGHAASRAYAQRVGETVKTPKLLGTAAEKITDLTGCLAPSAANAIDADGTAFSVRIILRDFPTSGTNHPGTVIKARLRYELVDDGNGGTAAPTVALAFSSDQDGGTFTTLSNPILEGAGTAGGGVSDGSKYTAWPVGKMRERVRFRITVSGAAASFKLRTFELLVRQGRLR